MYLESAAEFVLHSHNNKMVQTRNVDTRQKTEECTSCMGESVLFNSDSLFKIASYLPAEGLLNLALTCRRFGIAPLSHSDVDDSISLIEETARRIVQDDATEEQMAALPDYEGDNWLSKYNFLQSLRVPLTFDQLVGQQIEYVEGNKSCVTNNARFDLATAFSNNIMMAGKHYVSFECHGDGLLLGVMRPGEAMQSATSNPLSPGFFNHFTQRKGSLPYNNTVNCCMCSSYSGYCYSSDWAEGNSDRRDAWDGMERFSSPCKIEMLLDLDEGTLSVYHNGRKLGVMKRGLAGQYCWVVSLSETQVKIKRGKVPAS